MLHEWLHPRSTEAPREDPSGLPWRPVVKRRITVTFAIVALWALAIEGRLVFLQVVAHAYYQERAQHQQQNTRTVAAGRGDILDRHGNVLAYTVTGREVFAYPKAMEDPVASVAALCAALKDCKPAERKNWLDRLTNNRYTPIRRARQVSAEQLARLDAAKIAGIGAQSVPVRYYPKQDLAAHLLGWVNFENDGQGGVEYAFDNVIKGEAGRELLELDAHRHWTQATRPPTPGANIELTIDQSLQYIVERELAAGVAQHRAHGGTAIVMDPWTGEVLALAHVPTFDPNRFNTFSEDDRRNSAVTDVYEPGSTFKIVTASAAIESGVIKPDEIIDTDPGVILLPGREPIDEASGHSYGKLTFEDVIVRSSNVGAVRAAWRVGADRMVDYMRRFGFGQTLGTDFRGQSAGKVWSRPTIDESALASMGMGYQVSVTPLQMVTAASAVANGGLLLEPHIVGAIDRDGHRQAIAPRLIRRAIDPETAATLTTFMEGVVDRGTGVAAALPRYRVAGKTGTAAKLVNGRYSKTEYNASFVGFVPSRRPALTILVVVDTPTDGKYYGGDVAAPIFHRIAEAALVLTGVPPTDRPLPSVILASDTQVPPRRASREAPMPVIAPAGGRTLMPDLRGLSARDALRAVGALGLNPRLVGDGFVSSQSPAAGAPVEAGDWAVLRLQRSPDGRQSGGGPK